MKQIALGVLTYNHPDVVSDILETSKKTYSIFADFGLDIYYLDSSETKETKEIVEREIKNGFTNLYYVNIPSKMSPAKKLQNFLMGKYCNDEYNYYWPIKDRVIFNVKNLMDVYSSALIGQYDLIFLDGYGKNKGIEGETHDYFSCEVFYKEYGWEATSLDTTIYSKNLLSMYKWSDNEFDKSMFLYYFLQIDVIFRGLSLVKNPKIHLISDDDTTIYNHKGVSSMWINEILLIWKDHWIDVNKSLPSVYNPYKEHVIRSEALPDLLKNEQGFQVLCQKGILTKEKLESALSRLEQITDVPKETIISMVNGK